MQARDLLAAVDRSEYEIGMLHQERQQLYDAALKAYRNGEISSALSKLEKAIDLGKRAPGPPSTDGQYLALYEQIRSKGSCKLQQRRTKGGRITNLFFFDPDRELAIRCPLPGELDHRSLIQFSIHGVPQTQKITPY